MEKTIPDIGADVSRSPVWVPLQGGGHSDISGRFWRVKGARKNVTVNFDLLPKQAAPLAPSIRKVLEWYLRHQSEHSVSGAFCAIKHFLTEASKTSAEPIRTITDVMLVNYAASLSVPTRW
jgi:hypothetical protein